MSLYWGDKIKKCIISLRVLITIFIVLSIVIVVPQINSKPVMNVVNDIEQRRAFLENEFEVCTDGLENIPLIIQPKGLIDTLIALLELLIKMLNSIIDFLENFMELGDLILTFIDTINRLIDKIVEFIEWLQNIFNPENSIDI